MNITTTPIANLSFHEDESILYIQMQDNAVINLENAKTHYSIINDLVKNKKHLALIESSVNFTIEKEAWQYASFSNVASNRIAMAHYNPTLANRLNISYFKIALSSSIPLEIFKTKEDAIQWLKSFNWYKSTQPNENDLTEKPKVRAT